MPGSITPPNSGRRRAALRVKQKRRDDQRQWSPSGKLLTRRPHPLTHSKPWNDRFIYEEDSVEQDCTSDARAKKRLGSAHNARRKLSVNGKENNVNRATPDPTRVRETCEEVVR